MALLLLASVLLLGAAIAITARFPARGMLASLLAVGLVWWAMVLATILAAGLIVRDFSPLTLVAFAMAWAIGATLAAHWSGSPVNLMPGWSRVLAAARSSGLGRLPVIVAAFLVGLTLLWRAFLAVRLPVVDVLGWQYHLVSVDVWLQTNALVRVSQNIWTDGWPADGELLTTWLAAFTRTDAFAGFTAILPIPIAMVATAGLAREFGAGRVSAALAGLLLGTVPAIVSLAGTSYVDTAAAAAVVAAWWLGLRILHGERDRSAALLFGISVGLALGTKVTDLLLVGPMVAAVGLVMVNRLFATLRAGTRIAGHLAGLGLALLPILIFGVSWYVKNLLVHGNPLFPVAFGPFIGPKAAGTFGAPPVPADLVGLTPIEQLIRSWTFDWQVSQYLYNLRPGGFGLAWVPVLMLATGGAVVLVTRRSMAAIGLVVAPAIISLALLTSPWYARYTLFIPAVGLPLAAVALHKLHPSVRSLASAGLVVLATASLVIANVNPNILITRAGSASISSGDYLALVLTGTEQERMHVSLRAECAELNIIPPGSRVAVARGFFLPHAVAGPMMDRILTKPLRHPSSVEGLRVAMEERRAKWLVARESGYPDLLAAADPLRFRSRGSICAGGRLWRYVGEATPSARDP